MGCEKKNGDVGRVTTDRIDHVLRVGLVIYAGAQRASRPSELLSYQRRGWHAEEKIDGVYVELVAGAAPGWRERRELGRISQGILRSGRRVGCESGRDVLGVQTGWAPGTRVVGELLVQTPAAARWQDAHGGVAGVVLYDLIAEGDWIALHGARDAEFSAVPYRDWTHAPQAERFARLRALVAGLDGPAARALHLVEERATGLRGFYREVLERGGEGIVLVDPSAPVQGGKRKVKRRDTLDCRVLELLGDEGVMRVQLGSRQAFAVSLPRFALSPRDTAEIAHLGWD